MVQRATHVNDTKERRQSMNQGAAISEVLASDYRALEQVDQALRQAERNLLAAHFQPADRVGPRPEVIFQEVLTLRAKSRQLLTGLGEKFATRH